MIEFSSEDEILLKQLHGYNIAKTNASGMPIYESGPAGDHDLDAFMLALVAFEIELGEYTRQSFNSAITFSGSFGQSVENDSGPPVGGKVTQRPESRTEFTSNIEKSKLSFSNHPMVTPISGRIYSHAAFNNDDKNSVRRIAQSSMRNAKNSRQISRRLF
jgi:hypothetical protein